MNRLALIYAIGRELLNSPVIAAAIRSLGMKAQIRDASLLAEETVERADEIVTMLPEDASDGERAAIERVQRLYPEHRVRPHTQAEELFESHPGGGESQDGAVAGDNQASVPGGNAGAEPTDGQARRGRRSRAR